MESRDCLVFEGNAGCIGKAYGFALFCESCAGLRQTIADLAYAESEAGDPKIAIRQYTRLRDTDPTPHGKAYWEGRLELARERASRATA